MITSDGVKAKIDAAREKIGRDVTFYTPIAGQNTDFTASGYYDPMSYTGFNPTLETTVVKARVHWTDDERITATPGGKFFVGDCTLGIDPAYRELAEKAMLDESKIVVDGKDVIVIGIDPKGVMETNRLRLICKTVGSKFVP